MGGVHIIPIYGAKGLERTLSRIFQPAWMEMLGFTVTEGKRLRLGRGHDHGHGVVFRRAGVTERWRQMRRWWCRRSRFQPGTELTEKSIRKTTQALMAFGPDGKASI